MLKMVGLSRAIKQEWLNKAAELAAQATTELEIKEALNEYLSYEIKSPTILRKTRKILLNVWYRPPSEATALWREAVNAFQGKGANKPALNWAMILAAYPIFYDVCSFVGKISRMQDTFTTAWLKEKLYSIWGERPTLYNSYIKILQTLKYLGAIENVRTGVYKIRTQRVADKNTVKVMMMALLALDKKAYYDLHELSREVLYFPFEYEVNIEWLQNTREFCISNLGGKMVVSSVK
jgi:hypothetical protein